MDTLPFTGGSKFASRSEANFGEGTASPEEFRLRRCPLPEKFSRTLSLRAAPNFSTLP